MPSGPEAKITVTLPLPPNRANARWHWRTENRKRDNYFVRCCSWRNEPDAPKAPRTPLPKAKIRATLYVWQLMDADNLMARLKWCLDFLVDAGFLEDDGPKHLEWVGMPEQYVDRSRRRVEITLEAA